MERREFLKFASLGSGWAALSGCAGVTSGGLGPILNPSIVISPFQMMQRLSGQFPVERNYRGLAKLKFADPVCSMVPEERKVRVGMSLIAGLVGDLGQSLQGRCQMKFGVNYNKQDRGVYLVEPSIETLGIQSVPQNWTQGMMAIANIVGQEYIQKRPVYTLPDSFGYGLLKSMQFENGGVRLSFGLV